MDLKRLAPLMIRNFLFWLSRRIDYPLVPADALQINFMFLCNLRCKMCSMHERMDDFKKQGRPIELEFLTIKKMIKEGADMKVRSLILIGGEPFMEPRLSELVTYADQCGIPSITVVTNATIMSEKIVEGMFASNLSNLSVSIDAASEDVFSRIRGQNYLNKIIANIELLNSMKAAQQRHSPSVCSVCTIMDQNIEELMDVVELCRRLKICKIIFQPVVGDNTDQMKSDMASEVFIPPSRYAVLDAMIDKLIQFKLSSEANYDLIANTVDNLEAIKVYFKGRGREVRRNCYAGYNRIQIVQEGKLYFCIDQTKYEATFGDVNKDSLKDLWYSKEARFARKLIRKCRKPCLQWCSYRDDFDRYEDEFLKNKLFKKAA